MTVKQLRQNFPHAEFNFFRADGLEMTKQDEISQGCPLYYAKVKEYKIIKQDPSQVIFITLNL